jgi:thiamine-phosphate pyrophosphorylase
VIPSTETRLRRGVYLVTRETPDDDALLAVVEAALEGGAVLVQYRDKSNDAARRRRQASALGSVCRRHAIPLLINDDVDLARAVGAAGVHLGEHDGAIATARAALGRDAIIGVSCYDDPERAAALAAAGADYLAFGAFFPSSTKPAARRARPGLLREARRFGLPTIAIGGIDGDNAASLIAAGADLVAVISAIFDAPDPRAATRRIKALFDSHENPETKPA